MRAHTAAGVRRLRRRIPDEPHPSRRRYSFDWSPSNKFIASCGLDRDISLWSAVPGLVRCDPVGRQTASGVRASRSLVTPRPRTCWLLTLARPNARASLVVCLFVCLFVFVCFDRRNPYTAKTVMTLTGHPCSVKAVAFNERFSQVGRVCAAVSTKSTPVSTESNL